MAPLRICFVTHAALPHVGGVEVAVDNLGQALIERGNAVEHIAAAQPADSDATLRSSPTGPDGVVPRTVPAWHVFERLTGMQNPFVGPEFLRVARDAARRVDVVHAHTYLFMTSALALVLAARAAREGDRPVRVLTDHGSRRTHDSRFLQALESAAVASVGRASLRASQAVIPINARVAEEVEAIRPGKLAPMIPNGVDSELYHPAESGEREGIRIDLGWDDRPRILFVGRLASHKGLDLALEVAETVMADADLMLIGPGETGRLAANVTSLGLQTPAEVARLYRAADCLLVPSRAEGFPLVLQEGMASGLPAVVTDDPGYEPHLAAAPPGVERVRPESDEMARALRSFDFGRALDAAERMALSRYATERFSWSRCAREHEELYRSLLDQATAADGLS